MGNYESQYALVVKQLARKDEKRTGSGGKGER
jgi:hypothetical protein